MAATVPAGEAGRLEVHVNDPSRRVRPYARVTYLGCCVVGLYWIPPEQLGRPLPVGLSVKPCQSTPAPPGAMHFAWSCAAYLAWPIVQSRFREGPGRSRHLTFPDGVRTPGSCVAAPAGEPTASTESAAARNRSRRCTVRGYWLVAAVDLGSPADHEPGGCQAGVMEIIVVAALPTGMTSKPES